jgi:HK97 family phage major capsid protein
MTLKEQHYQAVERMKAAGIFLQELQNKTNGKPGEMPADDQEKFDKAVKDFDAAQDEIKRIEKLLAVDEAVNKASNALQVAATGANARKNVSVKELIGDYMAGKVDRNDPALKSLTVGLSDRGGLLVGREVYDEIVQIVMNANYVRRLATVFPLNNGVGEFTLPTVERNMTLPAVASEVGTAVDDTELEFGDRVLRPRLRAVKIKVGRLMDVQSGIDIWNLIAEQMSYVKAEKEEREFLAGNGASEPLGIFTSSVLGFGSSRTVSTGTANTIRPDDILDMYTSLRSQFRTANTAWIMHRNTYGRIRKAKDTNNNYMWSGIGQGIYNAQFLTGAAPELLIGYPVFAASEYAPDPGRSGSITTGLRVVAFGDFRQGYAIADSIATEIVELDQAAFPAKQWGLVTAYDARPYNQDAVSILQVS